MRISEKEIKSETQTPQKGDSAKNKERGGVMPPVCFIALIVLFPAVSALHNVPEG